MSKGILCVTSLLLVLTGVVLATPAQKSKAPAKAIEPAADAFGEGEYRLGAEDVVSVFVYKEEDLSVTATVRPDGKITVPMIGEIVATRKTARELETELQGKFTKYFDSPPQINVIVKEVNSPKVSVVGEVKKPDVYRIKQKTTVLGAIALAGGLTEFAKQDKVVVIRDGQKQIKLNLDSMLHGSESMFYIQPGDTIYVP